MKFIFNSLTDVIRAASPSIFSFIETTLPYSTPMPIALISSSSAATFFGLKGLGLFLFVYSLEGIGLIATTKLVEAIVDFVRGRNMKTLIIIAVLIIAVYAYITILVSLNVKMHTEYTDENFSQALTLICYLPLIAGVLNGLGLLKIEYINTVKEAKELEERRHQESREDRNRRWELKHGVRTYPADTDSPNVPHQPKQKMPGDFRDYVFELLDQYGELPLTEITKLVNKNKRTNFVHANAKGTWYKYVQEWKRGGR